MLLWRKSLEEEGWKWHVCFYQRCGALEEAFFGGRYEQHDHETRYENLIEVQTCIIKNILKGKKDHSPENKLRKYKKIYSLAANFYLSLSCCHYLVFLNACQKRSFISFDLQQRKQRKNLFSCPGTTYYKKNPSWSYCHMWTHQNLGCAPLWGP